MIRNTSTSPSACASTVLAAIALAASPGAWALGLGSAKVESYLNQPLRARIDLVSQASDDLTSVTAQLASAADYELIGASRESVSVPIQFTVENIQGDAYISATSSLPIGDPVLRLIVEVNWSSGRMLREYTLFLDPPTLAEPAPAPRIDQRKSTVAATAAPATTPAARAAGPSAALPSAAPEQAAGGGEYGPVRSGETLWNIAKEWSRGTGLTINQAMIAIQRENPGAFARGNINLLKRGAILRMPAVAEVEQISPAAAAGEARRQREEFVGRKAQASAASTETPLLADARADLGVEPEPVADVADETGANADQALAVATESEPAVEAEVSLAESEQAESDQAEAQESAVVEARDQLELIPPSEDGEVEGAQGFGESEEDAGAGASVQALREDLARTEEELINQQQQNTYLEERIKELEAQLESASESGVADADLANMEERLRKQRQAAATEPMRPWYGRFTFWLIGLLVLAAAFAGWLLSRRGQVPAGSLGDIKSEAEDVLRVLVDDTAPAPAATAQKAPATVRETPAVAAAAPPPSKSPVSLEDDAELLDEESSDPEIQLDLARAYISMGDKEAARVILQEVVSNGSKEQQADASKMLDLLGSP